MVTSVFRLPWSNPGLTASLAEWYQTNYLISLHFSFLIWKMWMIIIEPILLSSKALSPVLGTL